MGKKLPASIAKVRSSRLNELILREGCTQDQFADIVATANKMKKPWKQSLVSKLKSGGIQINDEKLQMILNAFPSYRAEWFDGKSNYATIEEFEDSPAGIKKRKEAVTANVDDIFEGILAYNKFSIRTALPIGNNPDEIAEATSEGFIISGNGKQTRPLPPNVLEALEIMVCERATSVIEELMIDPYEDDVECMKLDWDGHREMKRIR